MDRTERKATDYKGLSQKNHVLERKETYLGDCSVNKRNHIGLDPINNKLIDVVTDTPEGIYRCFLEVISNSGDNADASRRANVDAGEIHVSVNEDTISVKNGGLHIPVETIYLVDKAGETTASKTFVEGAEECHLPTFIFGRLMTSSNYDDNYKRMGCGRNGLGAKITNICSKIFKVIVIDPDNKKKYTGIWRNNMFAKEDGKPEITVEKTNVKTGSVEIEWTLDFGTFKLDRNEYTTEDMSILARITADFSYTCKVITKFNDFTFDYRTIEDYSKLIFSEEELQNKSIKYVWDSNEMEELPFSKQQQLIKKAKSADHIPDMEILIVDTPNNSRNFSFVNGLMTREGGTHLVAASTKIIKFICDTINEERKKKSSAGIVKVTPKKIEPHISFIVAARVINPEYSSQAKEKLTVPKISPVKYDEEFLKKLIKWNIFDVMYKEIEYMILASNKGKSTSRRRHLDLPGADANWAGTKNSSKCTLFIVEGDSATGYPKHRIPHLEGGLDAYGYLPVRGKVLNVSKVKRDIERYVKNEVINRIKQSLGLEDLVDYSQPENLETLRYGKVCFMTDADDDGSHILCLCLNLFREKFPGFIESGKVAYLRTPVIKIYGNSGKVLNRFFSNKEFKEWSQTNEPRGEVKYLKGLGSSSKKDVEDDIDVAPTVICFYDSKSENAFDMAFGPENSQLRKKWLKDWRDVTQIEDVLEVDINEFLKENNNLMLAQNTSQLIQRELVSYTVLSLHRAIPSELDTLKNSQRKILATALQFWKFGRSKNGAQKVGRFQGKVGDTVGYHHGEQSLCQAIVGLCQDFCGANNMPLFISESQCGTRADGGKSAAAPRYASFRMNPVIKYLIDQESYDIVPRVEVEGSLEEPYYIPFIVPVGVINGVIGVATAYSSFIPNHNPLDIVNWLINKCDGIENKELIPWYNGFDGDIEIVNKKVNNPQTPSVDDDGDDDEASNDETKNYERIKTGKKTMMTSGLYEEISENSKYYVLKITELPIGVWSDEYYKRISAIAADTSNKTRTILDCTNNSTPDGCDITIHWNKNCPKKPSYANLNLYRSYGISNITAIDKNGYPTIYKDTCDLLENYYNLMIPHFEKLKQVKLDKFKEEIEDLTYRIKFNKLVRSGEIIIVKKEGVPEDEIKVKMKEHSIPFKYYNLVKAREFSKESVEKYEDMIKELLEKFRIESEKTPQTIWKEKLITFKEILMKYWDPEYEKYTFE